MLNSGLTRKFLRSKIHRATVTRSDLNYEGSILIDSKLMDRAHLASFESVHIWNVDNGGRLETYAIPGAAGSGEICLNGAAARLAQVGDKVIIASFCWLDEEQIAKHAPDIIFVDDANQPA